VVNEAGDCGCPETTGCLGHCLFGTQHVFKSRERDYLRVVCAVTSVLSVVMLACMCVPVCSSTSCIC
jgi:hypothetical protein